ncbi:MAG: hypothetical protein ACLGH3_10580 [Actinomycetota bacterium]
MKRILWSLVTASAVVASVAPSASVAETTFRVGAAVVDVSPSKLVDLETETVCLGGFGLGCSRPAVGERETLYARAVVVESEGQKIVFATSSNVGLFAGYQLEFGEVGAYDIRRAAADQTGIPTGSIMFTSDHSHTSPDVEGIWGGVDQKYLDAHKAAVVQAIVEADAALEPADIVVGATTYAPRDPDHLKNHWDGTGGVLDQIDREFRVMQATSKTTGDVIVTLSNFSAHASILDGKDRLASGDWTGELGNRYVRERGGVGIAMVGAIGGIGARYSDSQFDQFIDFTDDLTDAALAASIPVGGSGVAASRVLISETITAPLLYAAYVPLGAQHPANVAGASIDRATTPPWTVGPVMRTYVSGFRIGDLLFAGVPGEAYPEIIFDLERGATAQEHFMFGLADDQVGYLISPIEGMPTVIQAAGLYPVMGNDNFGLSVNPLIGEHVGCSLLERAADLGFTLSEPESAFCAGLTATDVSLGIGVDPVDHLLSGR